jgi:3-hydroxyisobutyrate dehydrogenase-like beta-hydroxyacid dehydrogenase
MLSSTLLQSPIAWIGVGKMGLPLITHLLNAGVVVHIYDLSTERAELSRALGAIVHSNIQSLILQSKYIFSSLPNDQVLMDVATSQYGVLPLAQPGSTFTDTSLSLIHISEPTRQP